MSVQDRKLQELTLRRRVIAGSNEGGVDALGALARLQIERIKERLLKEPPATIAPLQGEAFAYARVLAWITESPDPAAKSNE